MEGKENIIKRKKDRLTETDKQRQTDRQTDKYRLRELKRFSHLSNTYANKLAILYNVAKTFTLQLKIYLFKNCIAIFRKPFQKVFHIFENWPRQN